MGYLTVGAYGVPSKNQTLIRLEEIVALIHGDLSERDLTFNNNEERAITWDHILLS